MTIDFLSFLTSLFYWHVTHPSKYVNHSLFHDFCWSISAVSSLYICICVYIQSHLIFLKYPLHHELIHVCKFPECQNMLDTFRIQFFSISQHLPWLWLAVHPNFIYQKKKKTFYSCIIFWIGFFFLHLKVKKWVNDCKFSPLEEWIENEKIVWMWGNLNCVCVCVCVINGKRLFIIYDLYDFMSDLFCSHWVHNDLSVYLWNTIAVFL